MGRLVPRAAGDVTLAVWRPVSALPIAERLAKAAAMGLCRHAEAGLREGARPMRCRPLERQEAYRPATSMRVASCQ